jgi:uracil-DNA glycosylase
MFTGDRSGDWLYRALFRAGVASQPVSVSADDDLRLDRVLIAATAHCAPPDNKPLPSEIENCSRYLDQLLARRWDGILCLGGVAWNHVHRRLGRKRQKFGHGVASGNLIASYHPSQQNTFTGRLTEEMLDAVIDAWLRLGRT